jgi:hypothetical protein
MIRAPVDVRIDETRHDAYMNFDYDDTLLNAARHLRFGEDDDQISQQVESQTP